MDVGVIGTGYMGSNHARIYSELKDVNNLFIYDKNLKAASVVAKKYNGDVCDSISDLLKHVDCTSICTPTHLHYEHILQTYKANVHCLIEKPICLKSAEAVKIINNTPKNIIVGVGHIEHFNPVVHELRKIIKNPLYIEIKRHNPSSKRITDTSVVEDLMIHDIDLISSLYNHIPDDIMSLGDSDICNALLRFDNTIVSLSSSRIASKKIRSISIEESDITIEGDLINQELILYKKPECSIIDNKYTQDNIITQIVVNKKEPLVEELKTFIDCIKTKKSFPISVDRAYKNLILCEKIYQNLH